MDIETHSDALGGLDVENFPTLRVTRGERVRFLGAITPQPEVADRLVSSLLSGNLYRVPAVPGLKGHRPDAAHTLSSQGFLYR